MLVKQTIDSSSFKLDRTLADYQWHFGPRFSSVLRRIDRSGGHWLDAGAGVGAAAASYYVDHRSYRPRVGALGYVTAVGREGPGVFADEVAALPKTGGRLQFIVQDFFESLDTRIIGASRSVDLITDVYGVLAYSWRPDIVLSKYLELLAPDGRIFIALGGNADREVQNRLWAQRDMVRLPSGETISFVAWLKRISGLNFRQYSRRYRNAMRRTPLDSVDHRFSARTIEISRASGVERVKIPRLELVEFIEKIPSEFDGLSAMERREVARKTGRSLLELGGVILRPPMRVFREVNQGI